MRAPSDDEIIAYADGEIDDPTRLKEIEAQINLSQELQEELEFYRTFQRVRDERSAARHAPSGLQMPPSLQAEIRRARAERMSMESASAGMQRTKPTVLFWKRPLRLPMPFAAAVLGV